MTLERVEAVNSPATWAANTNFGEEYTSLQNHSGASSSEQELATEDAPSAQPNLGFRVASGRSLLRHAETWDGGDLKECLLAVYATRGQVEP